LEVQKKKVLVMYFLLVAFYLFGIGTYSCFRRTFNGSLTGQACNLVLIENEGNAINNEIFTVTLNRDEAEVFIIPGDSNFINKEINIFKKGDIL